MKFASLNKLDWRRGANFNHNLSKVIKGQMKNYTWADLITVAGNELPISTESAMEEAEGAGDKLKRDYFMSGRTLRDLIFLIAKGNINQSRQIHLARWRGIYLIPCFWSTWTLVWWMTGSLRSAS